MSASRLDTYLDRMVMAGRRAANYVDGMGPDAFRLDQMRQDAVISNITAIGECVVKIVDRFPEFVAEHPEIPWRDIKNMRNRVAHQYFQLDVDTVWLAATRDIPSLLTALTAIDR